jgi:hypothetical protein
LFLRNAAGYRIQEEGIGEGGISIGEIGYARFVGIMLKL